MNLIGIDREDAQSSSMSLSLFLFLLISTVSFFYVYSTMLMRKFLAEHSEISNRQVLAAFKRLVSAQMKLVLLFILLMAGFIACIMYTAVQKNDENFLIMISSLFGSMKLLSKVTSVNHIEQRLKTLPCRPTLQNEYLRVVTVWQKKAWPNF